MIACQTLFQNSINHFGPIFLNESEPIIGNISSRNKNLSLHQDIEKHQYEHQKTTWLETNLECKVKSTFLFFRAISPKLGEVVVKSQIKWKRKVSEQILHQPPSSCTQRQLLHRKTKILHQTSENHINKDKPTHNRKEFSWHNYIREPNTNYW